MCVHISKLELLASISSLLFILNVTSVEGSEPKLKVSVYYETLCPYSVGFMKNQLFPVYTKMPELLDLDLVPYGNAKTRTASNGTVSIRCQHGELECYGNKEHACAISLLGPEVSAAFINCTMKRRKPPTAGLRCSKKLSIPYAPIKACAGSDMGTALLAQNGVRTKTLKPPPDGVPWITLNDVWRIEDDDELATDFLEVVCRNLNASQQAHCDDID